VKVLLDENLAHRLRRNLGTHEVFTVSFKGWAGFKNGELLRIAEENGIEVFLTGDQTLTYEQNQAGRTIAIVSLSSVEWDILKNHLPLIIGD
jgi:predicted nuclease of predicted toxin-antitoxin system